MKKTITTLTGAALLMGAASAHAVIPLVNVDAGIQYWGAKPDGTIQSGGDELDLQDDLGFSREYNLNWHLRVKHPVPLIPNFRIRYTDFDESATGTVNADFEGRTFSGDTRTTMDVSHFDYTIFYSVPLPLAEIDLGFNIKHFDGEVELREQTSGDSEQVSFNELLPMLHASARFDVPLAGVGVGAELNYVSYDGDSVSDLELYGTYRYNLAYVQAGYRDLRIDAEGSGDLEVDVDIAGPFVRLGVNF